MSDEDEGGAPAEEGSPAWMATFADLMSLLLTFFVLILSFANMDVIKFSAAVESLHEAFGKQGAGEHSEMMSSVVDLGSLAKPTVMELGGAAEDLHASLLRELVTAIRRANLVNLVEVEDSDRGVIVRIVGHLLFDPGSTKLRPESYVLLNEIALLIEGLPDQVSIDGHSDDTPGSTSGASSNWHISTDRAIAVLEYLMNVKQIDATRLSVGGYGPTRPIAPNNSAANREANRRVEFVFERPKEDARYARSSARRP